MQAAIGIPMTVYGTGGQTRGFIHVADTAKCIEAAVVNPPPANAPVEIFNQASADPEKRVGVEKQKEGGGDYGEVDHCGSHALKVHGVGLQGRGYIGG